MSSSLRSCTSLCSARPLSAQTTLSDVKGAQRWRQKLPAQSHWLFYSFAQGHRGCPLHSSEQSWQLVSDQRQKEKGVGHSFPSLLPSFLFPCSRSQHTELKRTFENKIRETFWRRGEKRIDRFLGQPRNIPNLSHFHLE